MKYKLYHRGEAQPDVIETSIETASLLNGLLQQNSESYVIRPEYMDYKPRDKYYIEPSDIPGNIAVTLSEQMAACIKFNNNQNGEQPEKCKYYFPIPEEYFKAN